MDRARMVFAGIVTAIFVAAAIVLILNANTVSPEAWSRLVYVFGGIEAIAFTAVGWVFGAEVNRQRADKAEERADQATQEKDAEAEKGHTLGGMVPSVEVGSQEAVKLEKGVAGDWSLWGRATHRVHRIQPSNTRAELKYRRLTG